MIGSVLCNEVTFSQSRTLSHDSNDYMVYIILKMGCIELAVKKINKVNKLYSTILV